ncbi:glucokinase [Sphingomonas nostoxanthinifaciens]|uniref:glucokinase n=1 Tax=Sphingomonas nostoxanthinifaciens TaxID=2872652 RepID=UPI001CC20F6C|nr:glucokinase [Sphingomonas nostoxanthinifaciens]UAK23526.1 glucokinase [Sphingomonas nostoxanthinifaciens]
MANWRGRDDDAAGSPGVVADIGGTNARFATATKDASGKITLENRVTLRTADFPSFESAFQNYAAGLATPPSEGVFALASPINSDEIKLTNNPWVLRPSSLAGRLGLERVRLVNDFEAIARSIGCLQPDEFDSITQSPFALPQDGVVSVVGPGSGLGVGLLLRRGGTSNIIACEGGHVGFAPADEIEQHILRFVQGRYPRVSAERLISGPGLVHVYIALAELDGRAIVPPHAVPLWRAALEDGEPHACAAVERWLMLLGAFAGDMALAHGAVAVVLAGGILPRFEGKIDLTPMVSRFQAKGRFEAMMGRMPIGAIKHPEPGLLGAATVLLEEPAQDRAAA